MEKSLLLVSHGSTFMVDALTKGLEDVGINVLHAEPRIGDLEKYKEEPLTFLFYLGNYVDDISDVLVYLKDLSVEKDKVICTIGDASEYTAFIRTFPGNMVKKRISRPLDIKSAADEMLEVLKMSNEFSMRKRILLVDDDATFLTLAKKWLDEDYRVAIVNSGMQAIGYLANNHPDLVLLDYEMPVTSGPKVLEMMRSETNMADIPVIFLTGKGDKESVTSVLSLKPDGYILKTSEKNKLLKQIEAFFDSQETF